MRMLRHLFAAPVNAHFNADAMQRIQAAIAASEALHGAEICFAVERALSLTDLGSRVDARTRALTVFSNLRVWDTETNNGVLIYVLLAEHAIEIVPDRDARMRIPQGLWQSVCDAASAAFRRGAHAEAVIEAVVALTPVLSATYPCGPRILGNELPDLPNIL